MPTRRLTLENAHGQQLSARLELPVHGRAKSVALVAHCFTCSKDLRSVRAISRAMTHVGIGVLRFDFTGLGQSEGEFAETTLSTDVDDLVAVAEQAPDLKEDCGTVELLVGHSLGGAASILAAERLDDVRAVATIGAPDHPVHVRGHFEESVDEIERHGEAVVDIAGRQFEVRREFLQDLESSRLDDVLRELKRPLLVMHSPLDEIVGIEHARSIFEAARHPKSFVALDGADHLVSDVGQAEYVGRLIASWARRYVETETIEEWRADADTGQITARTEDRIRTEVIANGFPLVADEPDEFGGTDTGPRPHDYLSAALASCTTMTLRMYADRRDWPLEAADARVDHRELKDEEGEAYDRFVCRLELEGDLDAEQRARLLEVASRCPVHRTLKRRTEVETELVDS